MHDVVFPTITRAQLKCVRPNTLRVGDIVLVRVRGRVVLHLIRAIDGQRCLIGNDHGHINGLAGPAAVYGIATAIEC
jgi:hypothetical protein